MAEGTKSSSGGLMKYVKWGLSGAVAVAVIRKLAPGIAYKAGLSDFPKPPTVDATTGQPTWNK